MHLSFLELRTAWQPEPMVGLLITQMLQALGTRSWVQTGR